MILTGSEHHHLSRVVRSKIGDIVWLFDEEGARYKSRIEEIGVDRTKLVIMEESGRTELSTRIVLGQALLKAKAMDFVVQKATELGLFALAPVIAERSIAKIDDRVEKKVERWMEIARQAAKQSRSGLVPRISRPEPLAAFLRDHEAPQKIFLCEKGGRLLRDLVQKGEPPPEVVALIGPEGGWTDVEEKTIAACGYEAVSLGKAILRAETAALCALFLLSHFWNW